MSLDITFDGGDLRRLIQDVEAIGANIPEDIWKEMVSRKGKVVMEAQRRKGLTALAGKYAKNPVAVVQKIRLSSPRRNKKDGWYTRVSFNGTQHGVANAEVAMLNEYGRQGFYTHGTYVKHTTPARRWIRAANAEADVPGDEAAKAVLYEFFKKHNL